MRKLLCLSAFAILFASPTLAQSVMVPQNAIAGYLIGQDIGLNVGRATQSLSDLSKNKQALSADIQGARSQFWSTYPNRGGSTEQEYARLLFAKDFFYIVLFLPEGPYAEFTKALASQGGQVDRGIPDDARPDFYTFVEKLRETLGAKPEPPSPFGPRQKAEPLIVLPERLLAALQMPDVQALYSTYQISRDRSEFRSAGHGQEFDALQLEARGKIKVSDPKITRVSLQQTPGLQFDYGDVPEDFVPKIETPPSNDVKYLYYIMKKVNAESLTSMHVWYEFFPGQIFTKQMSDMAFSLQSRQDIRQMIFDDAKAVRDEGIGLLECSFASTSQGTRIVRYYWYKKRPVAADRNRLEKRLTGHPFLVVGDALDNCPVSTTGKVAALPAQPQRPADPKAVEAAKQVIGKQEEERKALDADQKRQKPDADISDARSDFLNRSIRPPGAFGPTVAGARLGMNVEQADAAIRSSVTAKYVHSTNLKPAWPRRLFIDSGFSKFVSIQTSPASRDRVISIVSITRLPVQNVKMSDLKDELVRLYGAPRTSSENQAAWYDGDMRCNPPQYGVANGFLVPQMDADGPIWPAAGGPRMAMKEAEFVMGPLQATELNNAYAWTEFPSDILGLHALDPNMGPKSICGTTLFAMIYGGNQLYLTLFDKLWYFRLLYDVQGATSESKKKSLEGILGKSP